VAPDLDVFSRHVFTPLRPRTAAASSTQITRLLPEEQEISRQNSRRGDQGSGLRALRPVLGPSLLTAIDAGSVESAANDVITDPRKILHATAANQNDGMLLQIVTNPRDIRCHFHTVRQADTSHLSQRRVRLLGGRRIHAGTHPSTLRTPLQGRARGLGGSPLTPIPYQLVDGRQSTSQPLRVIPRQALRSPDIHRRWCRGQMRLARVSEKNKAVGNCRTAP